MPMTSNNTEVIKYITNFPKSLRNHKDRFGITKIQSIRHIYHTRILGIKPSEKPREANIYIKKSDAFYMHRSYYKNLCSELFSLSNYCVRNLNSNFLVKSYCSCVRTDLLS